MARSTSERSDASPRAREPNRITRRTSGLAASTCTRLFNTGSIGGNCVASTTLTIVRRPSNRDNTPADPASSSAYNVVVHELAVVGIGADGPVGLSRQARAVVEEAGVLAGSRTHLDWWQDHPAHRLELSGELGDFLDQLAETLAHGPVVLLASGDPLFFGIGRLLLERFGRERLVFYPHISSVQLAFSRVKLPWQQAEIVSAHGRSLVRLTEVMRTHPVAVAVLSDPENTPQRIARLVLDLQLLSPYRFWVCSALGSEAEQVEGMSCLEACTRSFAEPNVVILERLDVQEAGLPAGCALPLLGIPDEMFLTYSDQPGLMTKLEVRVLALAYLQLADGLLCWDIGSGTGSVAIEMARLSPAGFVYAVEKTAAGCGLIAQNARRLGVANLQVVRGKAPGVLDGLPHPRRVFVGGGGEGLAEILSICSQALQPGGILVANFATVESLTTAQRVFREAGWPVCYTQAQLSRSVALGAGTRLAPLNPVFILQATKPK